MSPPRIDVIAFTDLADVVAPGVRAVLDIDVDGEITATEVSGDMRVGRIRSRTDDVTLTAAKSLLDGDPADATAAADPADVIGRSINLTATDGTIGIPGDFLETDLLDGLATLGRLSATSAGGIYLTEATGNLRLRRVGGPATTGTAYAALTTRLGSILDGLTTDGIVANVVAVSLDLVAVGGSIGGSGAGATLYVNSSVAGAGSGRVYLAATHDVNVTETGHEMTVLAARSQDGSVTLTVLDTGGPRAPPSGPTVFADAQFAEERSQTTSCSSRRGSAGSSGLLHRLRDPGHRPPGRRVRHSRPG